jgi:hypothetical protein
MVIAAWVISVLAILLAPILLIRFRKRWVAAFNVAITNRITSRFAARLPGFGIVFRSKRRAFVDNSIGAADCSQLHYNESHGSSTAQATIFQFVSSLVHNSRRAADCSSP